MTLQDIYKDIGEVNHEETLKNLAYAAFKKENEIDIERIKNSFDNTHNAVLCMNTDGEETNEKNAEYKWCVTGLLKEGNPIYIAFRKIENKFKAFYVGTYSRLLENITSYKIAKSIDDNFYESLYDRLLIKEDILKENDYKVLRTMLSIQEEKLEKDLAKGDSKNYTFNSSKEKLVYNPGFLDIYGNYIYFLASVCGNFITSKRMINSKSELLDNKISGDFSNINPIIYYNKPEELIFKGNIEEFDLENYQRFYHILTERSDRFPESAAKLELYELSQRLKASILFNIKMSKIDYKWVVPMYNPKYDKIQYLIPFYINEIYPNKPELAIIINKNNSLYDIMTILPLRDAYINAKLIAEPANSWLKLETYLAA